jgi:hypothetical protein
MNNCPECGAETEEIDLKNANTDMRGLCGDLKTWKKCTKCDWWGEVYE